MKGLAIAAALFLTLTITIRRYCESVECASLEPVGLWVRFFGVGRVKADGFFFNLLISVN